MFEHCEWTDDDGRMPEHEYNVSSPGEQVAPVS